MKSFADAVFSEAAEHVRTRFWLISDLQQGNPRFAEQYFTAAMRDFHAVGTKIDGVCYLGDAAEGIDLDALEIMIGMQIEGLESLNVPIHYVIGNHELDYYRRCRRQKMPPRIPFYEMVKGRPLWRLIPDQEDFWFAQEMPEYTMLFFSDHASKDGSWCATHQSLPPEPELAVYPHKKEVWQAVRDRFGASGKPVFTFAHCAFPGGNRPSQFLEQLLPLPDNFRAHFHGHSHIGDAAWGGENLYRQIAAVNDHAVLQFDIASLDHMRGTTVRSAFFDYYGDGEYGVFFRDHLNARWEHFFLSAHDAKTAGIPDRFK